jgi:RNA polymerase sigma-70 factor (ECF subfamily)
MADPDLARLTRLAAAGDVEAFAGLYERFRRPVWGLCWRLLGSREAADDAASEVFLKAQQAIMSYDATHPFPAWLMSIARNYCVDQLRRRGVEQRLFEASEPGPEAAPAADPSPLAALVTAESREAVRRAIDTLPDHYRAPIVLRYYTELSYDEIAETLRLKRNHVAVLLFRARQELRRALARVERGRWQ